jgi:MoxR-like ATPase
VTPKIFRGDGIPHSWEIPPAPPWRQFGGGPAIERLYDDDWAKRYPADLERATAYRANAKEIELVNIAIMLRRPLLVTGRPGTGKSTLAYALAHELDLGPVLHWPITSRSVLTDGLYAYDAIARLQDAQFDEPRRPSTDNNIGKYIQLGPLGTALLPSERPRVLLIDEIDKSDVDLPNDLLYILEEGRYSIPELARIADTTSSVGVTVEHSRTPVSVTGGVVYCRTFPIIVMTSNGERDFPPAFLRRCVRLDIEEPDHERLGAIVAAHLGQPVLDASADIVSQFLQQRTAGELATDQLLNAIFLTLHSDVTSASDRQQLAALVLRHLSATT